MSRRPALQICTSSSSEGEEETEANPPSAAAAAAAAASRISIIELLPSAEAENEAVAEDDDAQLLGPPPIYSSSVPSPSLASLPQASSSSSSYSFSASLPHLSSSSPPPPPYASLGSLLHSRGVKPSSEWISECVKNLSESLRFPGTSFFQLPLSEQAQLCFSAFLFSDLNAMGNPSLPSRLHSLHATELVGPFILQVDEVVDISAAIRNRYRERPASTTRCLKLSMTDGIQRVFGIEYRPIKDLNVFSPAGLKIAIHHVNIRRGLLMLVPEVIIVLGGYVEQLETARQKVVQLVNKPPRGSRNITGSTQSLAETASIAAWATFQVEDTNTHIGGSAGPSVHTEQAPQSSRNLASGSVASDLDSALHFIGSHREDSPRPELENSTLTYSSLLKKNWSSNWCSESNMTGRIKCVLTGVKDFQYKNLSHFKLFAYIDDGSEISIVRIDHHIVEALIGFSPSKISEALTSSSPDEVTKMRENMIRFQMFLTRFEGILLTRKDDSSEFPVVIEMSEGSSNADAWSLVRRLQGATSLPIVATTVPPIEVSP